MSMSFPKVRSDARADAPAPADAPTVQISYDTDHVIIRVPIGQWNEALQEQAGSTEITTDVRAIAKLIASERSESATRQSVTTAARPAPQPDPRDAIPFTYCNHTRRILALVGFVVSSATILGVHMAGNDGHVPGFQRLPMIPEGPLTSAEGALEPIIFTSLIFIVAQIGVSAIKLGFCKCGE